MLFRLLTFCSLSLLWVGCKPDPEIPVGFSATEIEAGLRETIIITADSVTARLGKSQSFTQANLSLIPFPQQDSALVTSMKQTAVGVTKMQEVENLINRAAEQSVRKLFPIVQESAREWNVIDPQKILYGNPTDATRFFEMAARSTVFQQFKPIVAKQLEANLATLRWGQLLDAYNQIPNQPPVQTQLDNYVTEKVLDLIFARIAQEESYIRSTPKAQVTLLLQRIYRFA